jgi:hypothetical protein
MENQTRYDLNAAVENWRNELAAQPNLASDDRRELETHLRDAIERRMKSGMDAQRAFEAAVQRIGKSRALNSEFKKNINLNWKKIMAMAGLCGFTLFIAVFKPGKASDITSAQQLSLLASTAVAIFLSFTGKWGGRFFPAIIDEKKRAAAGILIVSLMCAGSTALLCNTNGLTLSQLFVAVTWGLNIFVGFSAALIEGLDRAAQKKLEEAHHV